MTPPPDESLPTEPSPSQGAQPYARDELARLASAVAELGHPTQIGPYQILEIIGEGGMGTVYKAEQRSPIQRVVAIKVIKLGMDTREVIVRFEAERQALALMDHANVARVIDAGATEQGRPYFVMEFVQGQSITRFADEQKLTIEERLKLFMQACDAVQHAHQKAVIHRDLKPSNILVTQQAEAPVVKVIDFGVSKAIDQRLTEQTFFTQAGQFVGTLEYMSPEQADLTGHDIDTRTDIYSLGVVLYELLIGTVPFDAASLRTAGYAEIQRIIREVEPPRPSTRLSALGDRTTLVLLSRRIALDALEKQLHRELDWIPLKALQKDRSRRYATAREFADDIANYLAQRPLRAGPESRGYRLRKFVRRNRAGVWSAAALVLVLLAGAATTTWQALAARRAQQRAEDASENLDQVNRFMIDDILASAAPESTRGRDVTVRQALDRSAASVGQRFALRPRNEAAVEAVLARTYDAIGVTEVALPHARHAHELFSRVFGADHVDTLRAKTEVGKELCHLNRPAEAEPLLRETYDRARKTHGDNDPVTLDALGNLAMAIRMQDRLDEAEPLYRRALDGEMATHGPGSIHTSDAMNNLAVNLWSQRRDAEAEGLFRKSLEIKRKEYGEDHPAYLGSLANLSKALQAEGKAEEAERSGKDALAGMRRVLKDDHPSTLLAMNDVAYLLVEAGKLDEGEALYREALDRRKRVLGPDDPDTLQSMQNLGHVLTVQEKYAEAETLLRDALDRRRRVLGPDAFGTINSTSGVAGVLFKQGNYAECASLMSAVCAAKAFDVYPPQQRAILIARRGVALARDGQLGEAEPVLLDARARLEKSNGAMGATMSDVLTSLITVYDGTHRPQDAANCRARLAELVASTQPTQPSSQPAR